MTFAATECPRCKGTGIAPQFADKLCQQCYGAGVVSEDFNYRIDGRVERMCEHGCGHTVCVRGSASVIAGRDDSAWWVHGCDVGPDGRACCADYERYTSD